MNILGKKEHKNLRLVKNILSDIIESEKSESIELSEKIENQPEKIEELTGNFDDIIKEIEKEDIEELIEEEIIFDSQNWGFAIEGNRFIIDIFDELEVKIGSAVIPLDRIVDFETSKYLQLTDLYNTLSEKTARLRQLLVNCISEMCKELQLSICKDVEDIE